MTISSIKSIYTWVLENVAEHGNISGSDDFTSAETVKYSGFNEIIWKSEAAHELSRLDTQPFHTKPEVQ